MDPLPHRYRVDAASDAEHVTLSAAGLPSISSAPPREFGGPGDQWSPETLFVAAAVDCFILTFRAIAQASNFSWARLSCQGDGVVDRVDGTTRFTALALNAQLTVSAGGDAQKAKRLLEKAERACLVTNSLLLRPSLTCVVEMG